MVRYNLVMISDFISSDNLAASLKSSVNNLDLACFCVTERGLKW